MAASSSKNQAMLLLRTYEDTISLTKVLLKGEECADKDEMSQQIGILLVKVGTLYDHKLNKSSKGLSYLQKALGVFQKSKDYKKIGEVLTLIGVIHVKRSSNQKALKCFTDSLVMRRTADKESAGIADTLHHIGNCEAREGKFESSLRSYEESLQIKRRIRSSNMPISIAKTEHCIGLANLQLGDLDAALVSFTKSLSVRRDLLGKHLDVAFSLHR